MPELILTAALYLLRLLAHRALMLCSVLPEPFQLGILPVKFGSCALQLRDGGVKPDILGADQRFCMRDDILRHTERAGDRKGVRLSRRTDDELIGRLQCFEVKFAGGVLHARCLDRVAL